MAENFIFMDFFAVFSTHAYFDVTSGNNLDSEKMSMKMKFLADKVYYNFSQDNAKIKNI